MFEHPGEELFALGQVAVAMEQDEAECAAEFEVGSAELQEGAAGGGEVEGGCVFYCGPAASAAGEEREGAGDVGADGVDGADVEAGWLIEKLPVEGAVAGEGGCGERAGFTVETVGGLLFVGGGLELGEYAVAHLGGRFLCEGDGEDLLGRLDGLVGQKLQVSLDEKAGLARTGRGFDDPGGADVKGLCAFGGVGKQLGCGLW